MLINNLRSWAKINDIFFRNYRFIDVNEKFEINSSIFPFLNVGEVLNLADVR